MTRPGSVKPHRARAEREADGLGVIFGGRRGLLAVGDAEPAADVHVLELDPEPREAIHEVEQLVEGLDERLGARELAADVAGDADDVEVRQRRGQVVRVERVLPRDAELRGAEACRDVGVRLGVHVGVDAQADAGPQPEASGHALEVVQLGDALDVETRNVMPQREGELVLGLADTRKHDARRGTAREQHAPQLALRDDVEATVE